MALSEDQVDRVTRYIQQVADFAPEILELTQDTVQLALEIIAETAEQLDTFLWQKYRGVGQPYGPFRKDMQRWFVEVTRPK